MTTRIILKATIHVEEMLAVIEKAPSLLEFEPKLEVEMNLAPNVVVTCETAAEILLALKGWHEKRMADKPPETFQTAMPGLNKTDASSAPEDLQGCREFLGPVLTER